MCWWSSVRDSGVKSVFSCQYLKCENVNKLINIVIIYKRVTKQDERKIKKWMNEWRNEWLTDWLTDWNSEWMNEKKWSEGGKKGKETLGSLEMDYF